MTELIKLDCRYVNPKYIISLIDSNVGYGDRVTYITLGTGENSGDVFKVMQPIEEVLEILQKSDNFNVIE